MLFFLVGGQSSTMPSLQSVSDVLGCGASLYSIVDRLTYGSTKRPRGYGHVRVGLEIEFCPGKTYTLGRTYDHWKDGTDNSIRCDYGTCNIVGREITLKDEREFTKDEVVTALHEWETEIKPLGRDCNLNEKGYPTCSMHVHLSTQERNRHDHDTYLKKMQKEWNNFYEELKTRFPDLCLNGDPIDENATDAKKAFARKVSLNLQPMSNKNDKKDTDTQILPQDLNFHIEVRGLPQPFDKNVESLNKYVQALIQWFESVLEL
jgi:hypothetical protein